MAYQEPESKKILREKVPQIQFRGLEKKEGEIK